MGTYLPPGQSPTTPISQASLPPPPVNLAFQTPAVTKGTATIKIGIKWDKPSTNGGAVIIAYNLYTQTQNYIINAAPYFVNAVLTTPPTTYYLQISPSATGTIYYLKMRTISRTR